ncbi:PAS domain-containing sensor histidine kinase [Catalinimonas sp. 4WD22]|uniref:PAS domain-containing sensor histidine kinase n=1 Tax=Catalinimonas locisalis TaxID=3133978 RepID=UPI003100CA3D
MRKSRITKNKQLETGEWLQDVQQLAKIGLWEYTLASDKLVFSEPLYELWEINPNSQGTLSSEQLLKMIHSDDVEEVQQKFESCIQEGNAYQVEYRVLVSGQQKFFETIVKPGKEGDRVIKVRGITQDITERKLAEEAFARSEKRFASIFRLHPLPVAITRLADGKIIEANDKALEVFGFTRQEIQHATTLGLNIWANPQDREFLLEKLKQQSALQFEATYRNKEEKEWNTITNVEVIELDQEQCMLIILQDITERKQAEEAIKAYSEQLEKVNAGKDKFFSIIAHDLMSPVNGIMGSANILSDQIEMLNQQEIRTFADSIFISVKHLKRLLSNLLEWARIHSGDIKYQPKEVNLHLIARDVVMLLHDNAQKKRISLHNMLPEDLILQADENMLHSMLRNLLSNAIKFSNFGGKVEIEGRRLSNHLQIMVSDNGVGMSEFEQQQLFQLGSKHTTLGTAKEKGTGLGLLLCKEFVEKHKGSIDVESEEGKITTFTITLPM